MRIEYYFQRGVEVFPNIAALKSDGVNDPRICRVIARDAYHAAEYRERLIGLEQAARSFLFDPTNGFVKGQLETQLALTDKTLKGESE